MKSKVKEKPEVKKSYQVLLPFSWRGRWCEKGAKLNLLGCEAGQLLRMGKIEESK